jgi:gluconolactonase
MALQIAWILPLRIRKYSETRLRCSGSPAYRIEGAAWVADKGAGYLLFTDFTANVVYKWSPDAKELSVFLTKSGYTGNLDDYKGHVLPTQYGAPIYIYDFGANGIALDPRGRVVLCAHGDREIVRLEQNGTRTVLATGYLGDRFYHPNEMAIRSDGAIYITDAHPGAKDDQGTQPKTGVFRIKDGAVTLAVAGQSHGIAFSPDEKFLYVTSYGTQAIMRYDVRQDGSVENGRVFVDMSGQKGAPNGMAVDRDGDVYSGGPGGYGSWTRAENILERFPCRPSRQVLPSGART